MKKLFTLLFMLFWAGIVYANPITIEAFYSPDDVTIAHLETFRSGVVNAINNADGGLIQARTITPEKMTENGDVTIFRDEAFNDFVYTGLIMPTSVNLDSTTSSGIAYIKGQRVRKDATLYSYTPTKWTYVDLKHDGTYIYTEVTPDVAPAIADGTVRLARVETDSSSIPGVTDLRILSITLENRQADFYRKGMQLRGSNATDDTLNILPGIAYWGNIRVSKITTTNLKLGTAGDWVTGGGSAADNTMGFVVVSNAGVIQLTTTAPSVHDLSGTTAGVKYYSVIGGNYYRVLAWFYMSDEWDGSIKINPWEWGNFGADMDWRVKKQISPDQVTTAGGWSDVDNTLINFYSSGGGVTVSGIATGYSTTQHYSFGFGIELDGVVLEETAVGNSSTQTTTDGSGGASMTTMYVTPELAQGNHTARLNWRQELGYTAHLMKASVMVEGK